MRGRRSKKPDSQGEKPCVQDEGISKVWGVVAVALGAALGVVLLTVGASAAAKALFR